MFKRFGLLKRSGTVSKVTHLSDSKPVAAAGNDNKIHPVQDGRDFVNGQVYAGEGRLNASARATRLVNGVDAIPNELELYYCNQFDPVTYSAKRAKDRLELFEKFEQDSKDNVEEIRKIAVIEALVKLLERIANKMGYDVLGPIARGLVNLTRNPFLGDGTTILGDDIEGVVDHSHHFIDTDDDKFRRKVWALFIETVAKLPKLPFLLAKLAHESVTRLKSIKRGRKHQPQLEGWTDVTICWIETIVQIASVAKVSREVLSKASTFEFLFKCYDAVSYTQYSSGRSTSDFRQRTLRIVSELCAVMLQESHAREVFCFAHSHKFLRKLILILGQLNLVHHKTEIYYFSQSISGLPFSMFEDHEILQSLVAELYRKLNIDLGPYVDDEMFKLVRKLDQAGDVDEEDPDDQVQQHVAVNKKIYEDFSYSSFRLMLTALVRISHHKMFGTQCLIDGGNDFTRLYGEIDLSPRSGEFEREENDQEKGTARSDEENPFEGEGITEEETEEFIVMNLKTRIIEEREMLAETGLSHLWVHMIRLHEIKNQIVSEEEIGFFEGLKLQVLECLERVMPPHTPTYHVLEVILYLFIQQSQRSDETVRLILGILRTLLLDVEVSRSILQNLQMDTLKDMLITFFSLIREDENDLDPNTIEQTLGFALSLGDIVNPLLKTRYIAGEIVKLFVDENVPQETVYACSNVLRHELFDKKVEERKLGYVLSWTRPLLDEGFLLLYQTMFRRCKIAAEGINPFPQPSGEECELSEAAENDLRILNWNSEMLFILGRLIDLTLLPGEDGESMRGALLTHKPHFFEYLLDSASLLQQLQVVENETFSEVLFVCESILYDLAYRIFSLNDDTQSQVCILTYSSPQRLTQLVYALESRYFLFMGSRLERNVLLSIVAQVAEFVSENKSDVVGDILEKEQSCRRLFESFSQLLIQLVACSTPDDDDFHLNVDEPVSITCLIAFTKYVSFNLVHMLRKADINARLDKQETKMLCLDLMKLFHQQLALREDLENEEEKGVQLESICYLSMCIWSFVRYNDRFISYVVMSTEIAAVPLMIDLACEIIRSSPPEKAKALFRKVILVLSSVLYLLSSHEEHHKLVLNHPDVPKLLEKIVASTRNVCKLITHREDKDPNEGVVLLLGVCWRLGTFLPLEDKYRLKPLLPELCDIDEMINYKNEKHSTHTFAKLDTQAADDLNKKDEYKDEMEENTSSDAGSEPEIDEPDDLKEEDEEEEKAEEDDKLLFTPRTRVIDLVIALRQAVIELFDQMPSCDPFALRHQYRYILMNRVPAGLLTLASLRHFQQVKLNTLSGITDHQHLEGAEGGKEIEQAYLDYQYDTERVRLENEENKRRAMTLASVKARRKLKALRESKVSRNQEKEVDTVEEIYKRLVFVDKEKTKFY